MIGTGDQFEGSIKPSAIEIDGYEPNIFAHRHVEIPSNMQARWVYDGNGNCTYAGFAPMGLSESNPGWIVQNFTITSGLTTARKIAYGAWVNYASLTYS